MLVQIHTFTEIARKLNIRKLNVGFDSFEGSIKISRLFLRYDVDLLNGQGRLCQSFEIDVIINTGIRSFF